MDKVNIFDSLLEGCQIIDLNYRYIYVNDSAANHGQKSKDELIGKSMLEVYPGIEQTEMFAHLKRCLEENAPHEMVNEFQFPNGSKGWFELRMSRISSGVFILSLDITEQRKASLEESERRKKYQKILENLKDIVLIMNLDGRVLYVTPSVASVLGYSDEEFIGTETKSYFHPEDLIFEINNLRRMLPIDKSSSRLVEQRVRHKDGSYRTMEVVAVNLLHDSQIGGIVVTLRDVSDRKKTEERFKKIIENSKDMIYIIDVSGKTIYATPSVKNVIGYTPEEFMQKKNSDYIHPEDLTAAEASLKLILAAPQELLGPYQFRIQHKDGSYKLIEMTAVNKIDDPTIGGIIVTSRDITEWINKQREFTERNEELEKLNNLMVGREIKMIELKKKNQLLQQQTTSNNSDDKIDSIS